MTQTSTSLARIGSQETYSSVNTRKNIHREHHNNDIELNMYIRESELEKNIRPEVMQSIQ